jgi:hypothetical protein
VPRNPRRKIVGKGEDVEQAAREKKLARLEHELHEDWANQDEPPAEADTEEPPEALDTDTDEPTDERDK